jgi:UDP:flavonoid glycosyltransferase YjiC (YdhE family)
MPKTICLGINPLLIDSAVTGLPVAGLPFEDSPAVRARHQCIMELLRTFVYKNTAETHTKKLQEAGCTSWPEYFSVNDMCLTSDVFLQLCGPSFEYPDSARDPKVKFVGSLPPKPPAPNTKLPGWWPDITKAAGEGKKVVFLAQGSLQHPPEALLLPTIRALADESDILLVVTIGTRGSTLPPNFPIPANTRVLDFFPYSAILEYADVFIFNAGYGGASQAIGHAVPMIIMGELGQEKPEIAARIEWSGLGLVIRSPEPEMDEIRFTVRKVLDGKFKERALVIQKESKDLDPLSIIEKQVREFTA